MEDTVRVCDLMERGVIFCYPEDSLAVVIGLMKSNQFRSVVVVHESGEVWGLISIMDVIRFHGEDLQRISAEEIMKPFKIEVDPQWPIERAIPLMKKYKIDDLIIIDPHAGPKRPIGVLTSFDIVRHMSNINTGHFEQMLRMHHGVIVL